MRGGRRGSRSSVSKNCEKCEEYINGTCKGTANEQCLNEDAAECTPEQEEE